MLGVHGREGQGLFLLVYPRHKGDRGSPTRRVFLIPYNMIRTLGTVMNKSCILG